MAGFYLILDKEDKARTLNAEKAITNFDDEVSEIIIEENFTCIWNGVNDKKLWGPAYDPSTGIRVIISGRIHLNENNGKKLKF